MIEYRKDKSNLVSIIGFFINNCRKKLSFQTLRGDFFYQVKKINEKITFLNFFFGQLNIFKASSRNERILKWLLFVLYFTTENPSAQEEYFIHDMNASPFFDELVLLKENELIDTGSVQKKSGIFATYPAFFREYLKKYEEAKSLEENNFYMQAMNSYVKTAEFLENIICEISDSLSLIESCSMYEELGWLYKYGGNREKSEEFFTKSIQCCYAIAEDYIEKELIDSASQYVYKGEYLVTLTGDRIHNHDFRELHRKIRQVLPFFSQRNTEKMKKEFYHLLKKRLSGDNFFEKAMKLELYSLIYETQGVADLNRLAQKKAGNFYARWANKEKTQGHLLVAARFYEKASWVSKKAGEHHREVEYKNKAIEIYRQYKEYLLKEKNNNSKSLSDPLVEALQVDIDRLSYRSLGQKIIQGLENIKERFLSPFYQFTQK